MKGTPDEPRCGFSNRAASVLKQLQEPFASVIYFRSKGTLVSWSDFPTMPQVLSMVN